MFPSWHTTTAQGSVLKASAAHKYESTPCSPASISKPLNYSNSSRSFSTRTIQLIRWQDSNWNSFQLRLQLIQYEHKFHLLQKYTFSTYFIHKCSANVSQAQQSTLKLNRKAISIGKIQLLKTSKIAMRFQSEKYLYGVKNSALYQLLNRMFILFHVTIYTRC